MSRSSKKWTRFFAIVFLIVAFYLPSTLCGQCNSLETVSDLKSRGWKIEGNFTYIDTGFELREFATQLPPEFSFKDADNIQGVWIIFPKLRPRNDSQPNFTASYTNTVTFSFDAADQLFDKVHIKFVSVFAPKSSSRIPDQDLPGFLVEIKAKTLKPGDVILIDRILVTFVETTPTPKPWTSPQPWIPPPTTTPLPKNEGCRQTQLATLAGIIAASSFLWSWNLL